MNIKNVCIKVQRQFWVSLFHSSLVDESTVTVFPFRSGTFCLSNVTDTKHRKQTLKNHIKSIKSIPDFNHILHNDQQNKITLHEHHELAQPSFVVPEPFLYTFHSHKVLTSPVGLNFFNTLSCSLYCTINIVSIYSSFQLSALKTVIKMK